MDEFALFLSDSEEDGEAIDAIDGGSGRPLLVSEIVIECPVVIEFVGNAAPPVQNQDEWVFNLMTEAIRQA